MSEKKILYIRIDSSPLPEESDEIIVKDFNLESYFCTLLGNRLLEEAGLSETMLYPGKLIADFEKFDKEGYRAIIQQWEEALSSLLVSQSENDKDFIFKLPGSYISWLKRNDIQERFKISDSLTKSSGMVILRSRAIYEIIHSVLLKKLTYFLKKNADGVKCIVFSIDGIGKKSFIHNLIDNKSLELRNLRQSCIFLPYDEIKTSNTSAILKENGGQKLFLYGKGMFECTYDEIDTSVNGYARVRKDDKWGIINDGGVETIPCSYDFISSFYKESFSEKLMAYARKGEKWGYINMDNEVVIPFKYEDINSFKGEYALAKLNGKWGTIDKNNQIRIPFIYETPMYSGYGFYDYYFVTLNSKQGIIKNDGSEYLPCIFDRIKCDSEFNIIVCKDGRQDVVNFYNQYGFLRYKTVETFCNGMAIVKSLHSNKYGFINEYGDEVIYPQYELKPDNFDKTGVTCVCKNGKYGLIDKRGKVIAPFLYDYITGIGYLKYAKKQGKYGYINNKGEEVIPFIYDDAGFFDKEFVARVICNGNKSCIDIRGNVLFNHFYDSIGDFCNGVAVIRKDGKIGLINRQGEEVWPCDYYCDAHVNRIYLEDFLIVSRGKKYGILNMDGEELIPCILDEVSPFCGEGDNFERYGVIKRNNKYALIEISKDRKHIKII